MLGRLKTLFGRTSEFGGSKRLGHGRGLFYFLAYFLVFAFGINLGKSISDREHAMNAAIAPSAAEVGGEEVQKERFKKQMAMEIERRIRNQVEEQVKAEMDGAFAEKKKQAADAAEIEEQAQTKALVDPQDYTSKEHIVGGNDDEPVVSRKTATKKSSKKSALDAGEKRAPASAAGLYSIELSKHEDKPTAEAAQRKIQAKGLKAFRRKIASEDGEFAYGIYLGKFATKEEAKAFQANVLPRKGLKSTGKVKVLDH